MFDFLTQKFSSILSSLKNKKLSESTIDETLAQVKDSLIQADVPFELAVQFTTQLREKLVGITPNKKVSPSEQILVIVHEHIKEFLGHTVEQSATIVTHGAIMVMGLQGSGKTTSLAKIGTFIRKQKENNNSQSILLASVDFYRPAAIDQLEAMARKAGVPFFRPRSTRPLEATHEILRYKKEQGIKLLLLDTAGRMHVDQEMMRELKEIRDIVNPTQRLLVLDAMTGQESLSVARSFDENTGFDAAVLSKFDSDSRGGAAFSFRYSLQKPILFIGTGEKVDDLELFKPDRIAGRLLGMGDIEGLTEKANAHISADKQQKAYESLMSGNFTLQDFAEQMEMVQKLGSITSLLKYIPGMGALKMSSEQIERGEREMKRFKAIINSMTLTERQNHKVLNKSRIKRIAQGAGVDVQDVNLLVQRFEQSKQYVTLFKNADKFNNLFK